MNITQNNLQTKYTNLKIDVSSNMEIFIDNSKVIKYFNNPNRAHTRKTRTKYLNGNVPEVKLINDNMYSYDYVPGKLLSDVLDESVLNRFLEFCQVKLFTIDMDKDNMPWFLDDCKNMYEDKTKNRLTELVG